MTVSVEKPRVLGRPLRFSQSARLSPLVLLCVGLSGSFAHAEENRDDGSPAVSRAVHEENGLHERWTVGPVDGGEPVVLECLLCSREERAQLALNVERIKRGQSPLLEAPATQPARRGEVDAGRWRRRRAAVILAGFGLAAGAVGGVFLGFDGRCAAAEPVQVCSKHDLAPGGWAAVSVGAVAVVASVFVLLVGRGREKVEEPL